MEKNITCINCPMGCYLTVTVNDDGSVGKITGHQCKNGLAYAEAEVTNPTRMMTSTVRLIGAAVSQLPVKSANPVPKDKVRDCVRALKPVDIKAPVSLGDVILADVCGTGVDIIATRTIPAREAV